MGILYGFLGGNHRVIVGISSGFYRDILVRDIGGLYRDIIGLYRGSIGLSRDTVALRVLLHRS